MTEKNRNIIFYPISAKKMFWCTVLSLGFYQLFWFYKNWQAIRFVGRIKINPILSGWIFSVFYVFQLFFIIKKRISPSGVTVFCLWAAPILFIFDLFLSLTLSFDEFTLRHVFYWFLFEFIILIVTAFVLSIIQKSINKYNPKQTELKKKVSVGEFFTIIFLPIFFVISFSYNYINALNRFNDITSLTDPQKFLTAINFKHMVAYPAICQKHGYDMKFYRKAFTDAFTKEYTIFDKKLQEQNSDITKEWGKLPVNVVNFINDLINSELKEMQKTMIKASTEALGNPIATEEIPEELKSILTIKDACKAIDYNATKIFKANHNQKNAILEKIKEL